jgi:sulfonate transport system substrate-binding protein
MKNLTTVLILITLCTTALLGCAQSEKEATIRLGYMTLWTESGLPAVILKNTEVTKQNNIEIDYSAFQYGPPVIEAALAKQVDIIFVGTVPSATLLSKSDDWIIVGRLAYFPKAIMARNGSGINSVKELEGKNIGVPFGTGPHPTVLQILDKNNLREKTKITNMRPAEMAAGLQTGSVDAIAWSEPSITLFEQQGLAYTIYEEQDIGYILVSKSFAQKNPQIVRDFLQAYGDSMYFLSENEREAYSWFSKESQFDISLVEQLALSEPNYEVSDRNEVDLSIGSEWIEYSQKHADYLFKEGVLSKQVSFQNAVDLSFLN